MATSLASRFVLSIPRVPSRPSRYHVTTRRRNVQPSLPPSGSTSPRRRLASICYCKLLFNSRLSPPVVVVLHTYHISRLRPSWSVTSLNHFTPALTCSPLLVLSSPFSPQSTSPNPSIKPPAPISAMSSSPPPPSTISKSTFNAALKLYPKLVKKVYVGKLKNDLKKVMAAMERDEWRFGGLGRGGGKGEDVNWKEGLTKEDVERLVLWKM